MNPVWEAPLNASVDPPDLVSGKPPAGAAAPLPGWVDVGDLELLGGRLLLVDPGFPPSVEDGVAIDLSVGRYGVQAWIGVPAPESGATRLRVIREGETRASGRRIGTAWTETARIGVCDLALFSTAWAEAGSGELAYRRIAPTLESACTHGIAVLDAGGRAVMPFVSLGTGKGVFPVHELLAPDGRRVGIEVEFSEAENRPLPSAGTAHPEGRRGEVGRPSSTRNSRRRGSERSVSNRGSHPRWTRKVARSS